MLKQFFSRGAAVFLAALVSLAASQAAVAAKPAATAQEAVRPGAPGIVFKLRSTNERLRMTVNTSRIVTLEKQVPQVQVNNPEILQLTVLSPNQIQLSAKAAGVTQVNLWDENNRIYTIDVIVFGDARELQETLSSLFPNTSLKVTPVSNSVVISGFVDKPEIVPHIIRIAEEYYPKVINNITVGGVHQVLLQCKVMEVSRTKLRQLGFDFAKLSNGNVVQSGVSGLLGGLGDGNTLLQGVMGTEVSGVTTSSGSTLVFQVLNGGLAGSFYGVLQALREDKLMKILAEPSLVCYSGRPARFNVGGKIPYPTASATGTPEASWMNYGTALDFVPIVLGNGRIRIEVRPSVSELDHSNAVIIGGVAVPAIRERVTETGVEMNAGQTLAIAGLLQTRVDSIRRGLPWISELPYVGALFGSNQNQENEIELLIMVTPELVDAMNPDEVPPCPPGMRTDVPNDWELYMKRYIEVPRCCPPGSPGTGSNGAYCPQCNQGEVIIENGGTRSGSGRLPGLILRPTSAEPIVPPAPQGPKAAPATRKAPYTLRRSSAVTGGYHANTPNRYTPSNRTATAARRQQRMPAGQNAGKTLPGFIGPVGYDVVK